MKKILFFACSILLLAACKKELTSNKLDFPRAYIVSGGQKSIDVINLEKEEFAERFQIGSNAEQFPHHVYTSSDGNFLAVANPSYDFSLGHGNIHGKEIPGGIVKIDAHSGKLLKTIELPMVNHNVVFSPDGSEMWTAKMSHSGKVLVYDAQTGELKNEITVDADPSEVIFSADGKYGLVVSGESTFLQLIDIKTKELVKQIKIDSQPANVWPGYENKVLVNNMVKKSINIVDIGEMKVTDFLDVPFMPGNVAYNEKHEELWICNSMMSSVNVFKKVEGKWSQTGMIMSEGDPHMVKFYNGGASALLINQKANNLKFIDCESKKITKELSVGAKPNGIAIVE